MTAGRVGRAHGLDGSFHVSEPQHPLEQGTTVTLAGVARAVRRSSGTQRPPARAAGGHRGPRRRGGRCGASCCSWPRRPRRWQHGEWLADDLVGLQVEGLGRVARVLPGPSCDLLETEDGTLVPLVSDAVTSLDLRGGHGAGGPRLPGAGPMNIDVFTLFPDWFGWFTSQRHVRNALELGHALVCRGPARHHAAERRARWTTRPTAAARGWSSAWTWSRPPCASATAPTRSSPTPAGG